VAVYEIGQIVGYVPRPLPLIGDDERHWHVVITEPSQERSTAERLADRLQLKPYVPVVHARTNAGRGRTREILRPMIPNYLFLPLPFAAAAWREVRRIRGFSDFLRIDDGPPARLLPAQIEAIRLTEQERDAKWLRQALRKGEGPYKVGQMVWAEVLPWQKMLANIASFDARGRANVILEMAILGRKEWPVEPQMLQPVEV
jgi:transcription antitermination factor NusG